MKSNITREEFSKEVGRLFEEFAEEVWQAVVELEADVQRCDEWMRDKGSAYLREVLGKGVISHAVPRSTILDRRIMPGVKCLRRWRRVG